jgi:hypothetical protein
MPDPDNPRLGIRVAGEQAFGGREDIVGHLKGSGIDIDRHNLALVTGLDLRADLAFVHVVAAPRVLFLAVAWSPRRHGSPPL